MNLNSKAAKLTLDTEAHGFDMIGAGQPTGTIASTALASGRHAGKTVCTDTAHGLTKGSPIVVAGTTNYNGPTRVLHVIDADRFVIDKTFVTNQSGTWASTGGQGAWVGFQPIGADLAGASITDILTFYPGMNTGDLNSIAFTKDVKYPFPGIIKQITLSAGNIRLIRHSTLRPGGIVI